MQTIGTEEDIRQLAGQHFREGYNCAEAVLRAFNTSLGLGLTDDALRMSSGFGGGLGHAGCLCGALAASVMVLGVLKGRSSKEESREAVYSLSEGFHGRFCDQFGATCCRALNPHPYETREHLRQCLKITGETARLLTSFIEEHGIGNKRTASDSCQVTDFMHYQYIKRDGKA